MVWLACDHTDEIYSYGPVNQAELAELLHAKNGERVAEHFFVRDFDREDLDRRREEELTRQIIARFAALNQGAVPRTAAAAAGRARLEEGRRQDADAEEDTTSTEDGSAPAEAQGRSEGRPRRPGTKTKTIKWKTEEELEEYPVRVLKGATGRVFHQTTGFVFAEFFDDEKRGEAVAAFQYEDIVVKEGEKAMTTKDNLRFQKIVFDAERMMDSAVHGEVTFDYTAYDVHLLGKCLAE